MEKPNYYGGEYDAENGGKVATAPPGKKKGGCCSCFRSQWPLPVKICMIICMFLFLVIIVALGIGIHLVKVWTGDKDANLSGDAFTCTDKCITVDHSLWDEVLKEVVVEGLEQDGIKYSGVDYERLRTDTALRQKHLDYIEMLSNTNLVLISGDEALAFMINCYNAFTVDLIVKENIKKGGSIRDLTDPFKGSVFKRFKWDLTTNGEKEKFSLDNIEHQVIRGVLTAHDEPRVHGAVNCASVSCPDLRAEAFTGEKLNDQLEEQTAIWLQDPGKGIRLDKEKNEIHMSTIFQWFKDDFVSTEHGGKNNIIDAKEPIEYAAQFATKDVQDYLKDNKPSVKIMSYNWKLIQP